MNRALPEPPKDPTAARPEVRVPLYGLMKVTKRGYFIILGIEIALLIASVVLVFLVFRRPELPRANTLTRMIDLLPAIVLIAGIWLVLEALIVLRRFRREEAKQRG
jgi:nitrate reductase gamma subunit